MKFFLKRISILLIFVFLFETILPIIPIREAQADDAGDEALMLFFESMPVPIIPIPPGGLPVGDAAANARLDKILLDQSMREAAAKIAKIKEYAKKNIVAVVATNTLKIFLGRMAERAAQYVASGLTGQKSAIETVPWGEFLEDAGMAAAGEVAAGVGKYVTNSVANGDFSKLDIANDKLATDPFGIISPSIWCAGPSMKKILALSLLPKSQSITQPTCSLKTMIENWDVSDPEVLSRIELGFSLGGTDGLDILTLFDTLLLSDETIAKAKKEKELERSTGDKGGFKDKVSTISGWVQTPGSMIQKYTENKLIDVFDEYYTIFGDPFYDSLNVFSSTLLTEVTGYYLKQGLFNLGDLVKEKDSSGFDQLSEAVDCLMNPEGCATGSASGNAVASEKLLSNYISVSKELGQNNSGYNFINELAACPEDEINASIYNCSLSEGFRTALSKMDGEYLTVKEAIEMNLLDPDLPLGFSSPAKMIEPSIYEGYPYSALIKLRRARVIPIGWEIAAKIAQSRNEIKTLGELILDFDQRGADGICDSEDSDDSPYCNLVDPLWVLKGQAYNCRSMRYSQLFIPDSGTRFKYCADIQDCVVEDNEGNSCQNYAYCTREENVWRFNGDSCKEKFNTCSSFVNLSNSDQNYYLKNTLDYASCNADNVGCAWYAYAKTSNGNWDQTERIHFSRKILEDVCDSGSVGCNKYLKLTSIHNIDTTSVYSTKDVLNRIQTDDTQSLVYQDFADVEEIFIKIDPDLKKEFNPQFCSEEFVGCNQYSPSNGDADITAIVSSQDFCPAVCVGYDSFIQEPTFFEERETGIEFIPNTANVCEAQKVGCEIFTNLDSIEQGGEGIETFTFLRQCLNYGDNSKTYFYWVGTETGYQLNRVSLIKGESLVTDEFQGEPPAYITGISDEIVNSCNKDTYEEKIDPDCQELFDDNGNRWYRKIQFTVSSPNPKFYTDGIIPFEESCHPYRKTLKDEQICKLSSTCNIEQGCECNTGTIVCNVNEGEDACSTNTSCITTGGKWINGECQYKAIPSEGIRCGIAEVGCKEYKGSTGRNIRNIINDTFEDEFIDYNWGSLSQTIPMLSDVSVQFGGNSLKFKEDLNYGLTETCDLVYNCTDINGCSCITENNNACVVSRNNSTCVASFISKQNSYISKFLYKNKTTEPTYIEVYFGNETNQDKIGEVFTNSTSWEYATIGPIVINREPYADEKIIIKVFTEDVLGTRTISTNDVYIDNFILREESESLYAIENSWGTPAVCETDPPLVGGTASASMLGCQEYSDRFGYVNYLKSFSNLCPSDKVGCEVLINTQNSESPFEEIYQETDPAEIVVKKDSIEYLINSEEYYCYSTEKGCTEVAKPVLDIEDNVTSCSLEEICEDEDGCNCTIEEFSCLVSDTEKSCEIWDNYYVKNDPDNYSTTLCGYDDLKCEIFSDGDTVTYFKDPQQQTCNYKPVPGVLPVEYAWFIDGQETADKKNPAECICDYKQIEDSNPAVYAWFVKGEGIPNPPECTGLVVEDLVWANECPASQDKCTQFIEPSYSTWRKGSCLLYEGETITSCSDSSGSWNEDKNSCLCDNGLIQCYAEEGNYQCEAEYDWYQDKEDESNLLEEDKLSYRDYYINNEKIDKSSCNGVVDWEQECVLFNDTSKTDLYYTSIDEDNGINTPVQSTPITSCNTSGDKTGDYRCDTNVLLKVTRDRECGEWLTCTSAMRRWDPGVKKIREICFDSGRCLEADEDSPSKCLIWDKPINADLLDKDLYQDRNITWEGEEYSGHSIPNLYPVELLKQVSAGFAVYGNPSDFKLTYLEKAYSGSCTTNADCPTNTVCTSFGTSNDMRCEIRCSSDLDCKDAREEGLFVNEGGEDTICKRTVNMRADEVGNDCLEDIDCNTGDVCLANKCRTTIGRCYSDIGVDGNTDSLNKTCRGYPEEDSPIGYDPRLITYEDETNDQGEGATSDFGKVASKESELEFVNMGFTNNEDTDCSYKKVTWKNGLELYYNLITEEYNEAPLKIVMNEGDTENGIEATKFSKLNEKYFYGWRGYCLEEDPTRKLFSNSTENACVTWWPVDIIKGEVDIYTTAWDSVWQAPKGREYYCTNTDLYEGRNWKYRYIEECKMGGDKCNEGQPVADPDPYQYDQDKYSCKTEYIVKTSSHCGTFDFTKSLIGAGVVGNPEFLITGGSNDSGVNTSIIGAVADAWIAVFSLGMPYWSGGIFGGDKKVKRYAVSAIPNSYIDSDFEIAHLNEEVMLMCTEYVKIQDSDPLNPLVEQNKVWSTRIRASAPVDGQAKKGYIKYYSTFTKGYEIPSVGYNENVQDISFWGVNSQERESTVINLPEPESFDYNAFYSDQYYYEAAEVDSDDDGITDYFLGNDGNHYYLDGNGDYYYVDAYGNVYTNIDPSTIFSDPDDPTQGTGVITSQGSIDTITLDYSDTVTEDNGDYEIDSNIDNLTIEISAPGQGGLKGLLSAFGPSCFVEGGCAVNPENSAEIPITEFQETMHFMTRADIDGNSKGAYQQIEVTEVPVYIETLAKVGQYIDNTDHAYNHGSVPFNVKENEDINVVKSRLQNLFAKSYSYWKWDNTTKHYEENNSYQPWNIISQVGQAPYITKVVQDDNLQVGQRELLNINQITGKLEPVKGITVDAKNGVVLRGEKTYVATVSFYGYNPNGEQMPLRKILVNWGDDSENTLLDGYIKNHKHVCSKYCYREAVENPTDSSKWKSCLTDYDCGGTLSDPDTQCVPYSFGDDPDGCVQDTKEEPGTFIFTHVYTCRNNHDYGYSSELGGCVFRPNVMLVDNWGISASASYDSYILVKP